MKCKECSKEMETNFINRDELVAARLCHACHYWQQRVDRVNVPTQVVINGTVYQIGKELAPGTPNKWKGFGGARFHIRFNDGQEVVTDNLWHNGEPPEHFRSRLPDNAEFVQTEYRPGRPGYLAGLRK